MSSPQEIDVDPDAARLRALTWVTVALLALGLGACLTEGADRPPDPQLSSSALDGFGDVVLVADPPGEAPPRRLCVFLAVSDAQREQGLMEVTDLRGHDGMLFRFQEDTTGGFHMLNTPMPLSIAFFDSDGRFVGAHDMPPCGEEPCPTYAPPAPYRLALEVPQGRLPELGVGPGSVVTTEGEC